MKPAGGVRAMVEPLESALAGASMAPVLLPTPYDPLTASSYRRRSLTKLGKTNVSSPHACVRVALTWNSKTGSTLGTPSSSHLDENLDLHVYDADGALVATGTYAPGDRAVI